MKTGKSGYASIRKNALVVGITFAAIFWIFEAFLDRYVFHEENDLVVSLFPVDLHEFADRGAVAIGLMVLIGYSQFVVNKRQRAEMALREVGERFRSLVQHGSDIITVFDAKGTIRYESPSVERILGYKPEEMVGVSSFDYVHPDDIKLVSDSMSSLVKHPGVRRPIEFRIRHADGSWRYFESIANNLLEDPAVGGIVVNSRDVTERKQAEMALAKTLQMKTDFIADVSHELRTPLTVLRGNAEVGLEMGCDCVHKEILAGVVNQSKRVSRMVEDLLFLARSDTESLPLDLKPVAVAPFLDEMANLSKALVRDRDVHLQTTVNGEGRARMDPGRIEQAILVLVDNAAKYSPEGGRITFTGTTKEGELCIEVTDQGPGIPETELQWIFERFYRSEKTPASDQNGSGLGLPIAKTIAEVHGGRIEATSRENEGTRMLLRIPLGGEPQLMNDQPRVSTVAEGATTTNR